MTHRELNMHKEKSIIYIYIYIYIYNDVMKTIQWAHPTLGA